ncbi:T9SS C-terminal target domain-containing protein [Flavobacterium sp. KJJ]|uniref:T9SS C-terminal target domain-containing protein n=1 Tax=Flavobacterium sp. KJJ TaxID=1270193 RepID=UPI0004933F15|nr:T9SS C-terminal target domain-containing protein [Flavobacterium sp. KJJ]
MEKLLLSFRTNLLDIKKIYFPVLFILSSSFGFAQNVTTNKTVSANPDNCGIVNVKIDITGSDPTTRNSDVILAIDISGSMGNTISGDLKTSMDYAKSAAIAFIDQAKINPQNRIAIVAYSTTASLKIGLTYLNAAGVTAVKNQINSLQATNSTNIYAGILKSETELETNGRFDCSTARSIILLTDGVTNKTGVNGSTDCNVSKTSQCVIDAINASTNAKTTTKSSVVYNNQVFAVGLFGGISGNINTAGSDRNVAKYTLDQIQGSAAYITNSGANLTSIYNQIATQLSWVAQTLVQQETVIAGFTISDITTTKGTASASGQVITWNTDFLNSETITLNYQLTPTGSICGNQNVSSSTFNYKNSSCANDSKTITTPTYFVPCIPTITGVLTACGSTTLTANTNASSPTYVWYKDNIVINGETKSTLAVTSSGVYKVKVKNGSTNCELTSAASTLTISPAAALIAPGSETVSGCDTSAITSLPYKTIDTAITVAQLTNAGGSISNNANIGNYTLTYSDVSTGTCPTIVTRTFKVVTSCGTITKSQTITIQDTTAPAWTTAATALNVNLQCSDLAGLIIEQAKAPLATDNCTGTVTYNKTSGAFTASVSCSNAGTYTNTWTVKDDCGNTSETFTQVITIQDTTAPTWITQTASLNKTIECSDQTALASAQALFPVASDLCNGDVSNIVKITGSFVPSAGCSNAGTYTNTWAVKDDCGNTSETFTQVITIQDTTAPLFAGDLPTDITVSCDAVPKAADVEASDNCDGNLPIVFSETKNNIQNTCATNYTLTRKWSTSDCAGNQATYTQIITVKDSIAPTGTAPADIAGLQNITDIPAANPQEITNARDNCSGDVKITVSDSNNGASGCEGNAYILTRTYTLTDCAGNKTDLVQTFTVENKVAVSGVAVNTTCFGGKDGSILITNSLGSTVVITNENNEVVGNSNLPAGTYTLTATAAVNSNQTCTATASVIIKQPTYTVKIFGHVINADKNMPLANVPVTLIPQGTTPGSTQIRITNIDGLYSFSGMPKGNYLVQVQDANLNSAYQLYPVDSSLFFTALEDCVIQEHDFKYGKSDLPVLGDYVWYDTNGNGLQDEWYDANNDGIVTKNIPDSEGAIDYSKWEWLDLNGDGSFAGPLNAGELNAGGFGNANSSNIIIDGPNGYHDEVIIGIQGFWRNRPESANPFGDYNIKLVRDGNLNVVAAALGATGLVKVLPSNTAKKITSKTNKSQLHTVCQTTTNAELIVTVTPEDLVHLDADFGVNCREYLDIVANDDTAGSIAGVNHITTNVLNVLPNDTLEGVVVKASDVIITTVTPNAFLQLNPDGSVDVLPNAPVGNLTLIYQICEADQTSNCDTATVTVTIEAPVMTVTATPICVNDVPYVDYAIIPGNFTPINGVTIVWADNNNNIITTMTNLPLSGRILWPGAVVDQAGNGIDWPGWLFQNNKWIQGADGFETLRPTAKLTISVNPIETIIVNYPPADPYCIARPTFAIVANDDIAGPINGVSGGTNVVNVYTNDTLNNSPINPNDVTLTTVTPDPTGTLTLNPDGSVNVAPNTPAGTYILTYQICENADFGHCDTATVTIIVSSGAIIANDDSYNNIGCNTFGLVGNVLTNDLLNQAPATLQVVNFTLATANNTAVKTDPNITIDTYGNVNVGSLTPAGTYTYTYQICEKLNPPNCDSGLVTVTVLPIGVTTISSQACADDSTLVDLRALLPANTPATGTWIDTSNTNALNGNTLNPFGLALGNYVFEYKITDQSCPRSIVVNMEINDDCQVLACGNVVIHNAFSPNGDGINDIFKIDSIDDIACYPENTVEIYNRWGILVFETSNYNNSTNVFDGTSRGRTTVKESDGLPTGTYFYIVTYKSLDGNNAIQNNKKDGYLYLSK